MCSNSSTDGEKSKIIPGFRLDPYNVNYFSFFFPFFFFAENVVKSQYIIGIHEGKYYPINWQNMINIGIIHCN